MSYTKQLRANLNAALAELRAARHKLGIEYDIEERTVAESIELLKRDWQAEKHHVTKLICEAVDMKAERDDFNNAENRRASVNARLFNACKAFNTLSQ
jgi:hypothetical protein